MILSIRTRGQVHIAIALFLIALYCALGLAASDLPYRTQIPEEILSYDVIEVDPGEIISRLSRGQGIVLTIAGSEFELALQPRELRAPTYQAVFSSGAGPMVAITPPFLTYKGKVEGFEKSKTRLGVGKNGIHGFVQVSREMYFIEPLAFFVPEASPTMHLTYRSSDIDFSLVAGTCGTVDPQIAPPCFQCTPPSDNSRSARIVEIATDADYEYYLQYGANASDWILSILNQIEGIYEDDHEITFTVTYQNVWTTDDDPYTSTNPTVLLTEEFRPWWNSNMGSVSRDVAHLFTGKNLDGSVIGIAYLSAVCNLSWAYGLSQDMSTNHFRVCLTAHEMGHNFGGTHGDADSNPRTIMYPSLSSSTVWWFSDANIGNVASYISLYGGCLSPVPLPPLVTDLTISLVSPGTLQLDWTAEGEVSYRVYRGTEAYFLSPTPVADDVIPPWDDTPAGPEDGHYYYVRGYNLAGNAEPSNRAGAKEFQLP